MNPTKTKGQILDESTAVAKTAANLIGENFKQGVGVVQNNGSDRVANINASIASQGNKGYAVNVPNTITSSDLTSNGTSLNIPAPTQPTTCLYQHFRLFQ